MIRKNSFEVVINIFKISNLCTQYNDIFLRFNLTRLYLTRLYNNIQIKICTRELDKTPEQYTEMLWWNCPRV